MRLLAFRCGVGLCVASMVGALIMLKDTGGGLAAKPLAYAGFGVLLVSVIVAAVFGRRKIT